MRRLSALFLTALLLVSTVGVTVSRHYCGSILIDTSFIPHIEDACDPDMPMDPEDCSDDLQSYSVDSPKMQLDKNVDIKPAYRWIEIEETLFVELLPNQIITYKYYAGISPPPSEPNIYISVQSFLL
ncbi:MAG: hypothetical protein ABFS32_04315 [Bacteroidota bacterium]